MDAAPRSGALAPEPLVLPAGLICVLTEAQLMHPSVRHRDTWVESVRPELELREALAELREARSREDFLGDPKCTSQVSRSGLSRPSSRLAASGAAQSARSSGSGASDGVVGEAHTIGGSRLVPS
jgi:hypothetical protein